MSANETVQLSALGRTSRRWRRQQKPGHSIAQQLPHEILLQIFNLIPRVRAKPSSYITGQVDPMRHIPRVCKNWFNPGTEVLYKFVCVPRVASAMLFYRTLAAKTHPHSLLGFLKERRRRSEQRSVGLGSLVKILLLPKRVWVGCPPGLTVLFSRIINACDSLDEIQVICTIMHDPRFPHQIPRYPLPTPIGKHANLKTIALANAEASLWTNFPLFSEQFPNLEDICLSGFRISDLVDPSNLQPLLKLKSIRLESCDIGNLERWLMTCPALRKVEIDLSVWNVLPGGGVFPQLTILQWSRTSTPIDLIHISECNDLQTLTTDYHTFQYQWKHIPRHIQDLNIIAREADVPTQSDFSEFIRGFEGVSLGRLRHMTLRIAKENPWIIENAGWLRELTKEHDVDLELDLTKFGPLPVKPVVTLWHDGAQKIRRFTKPTRAQEIDWEQMYRQKG
ncbi:hypothetical protein M408DRAFT_326181 [Serendipita vermifera MAFF 305830]|uniref:F-box domain-containing protein n=1 Tax=Serendipita vermifera MAFF 305830 TaxID=933852 RepID=A0A0C3BPS9_SERVB|nr:hypothetical protein M408DRAFT_326181 [Serendipita vermifera MAFF 305830]